MSEQRESERPSDPFRPFAASIYHHADLPRPWRVEPVDYEHGLPSGPYLGPGMVVCKDQYIRLRSIEADLARLRAIEAAARDVIGDHDEDSLRNAVEEWGAFVPLNFDALSALLAALAPKEAPRG